jgi:hypothetical protein
MHLFLLPSARRRCRALHRNAPLLSPLLSLVRSSCCPSLFLYSDHSMGRCLVYGAFIDPVSSACHSTAQEGSAMTDPLDPADPTGVKVRFIVLVLKCFD